MAPSLVIQRCLAAISSGRVKLQGCTSSVFCVPAWSSWSPSSGYRAMFDV
jgi:hypothetical protein